jgi:DNA-binding response OmpR family regulator
LHAPYDERVIGPHRGCVLVVDDDTTVADVVTRYLTRDGYDVETVGDGRAALACAASRLPDLVVLDLMLPGLDGYEVYRQLRRLAPMPVIMLTARGREDERIAGLELGADDYLTKPFSPRELVARVAAVLRRAQGALPSLDGSSSSVLRCGHVVVDVAARQVVVDAEVVAFTAREFELLVFLMRHPRIAFGRDELLQAVWGWSFGDRATVTVHVRRVREKIERDPGHPELIATIWGVGYRFDQAVDAHCAPSA